VADGHGDQVGQRQQGPAQPSVEQFDGVHGVSGEAAQQLDVVDRQAAQGVPPPGVAQLDLVGPGRHDVDAGAQADEVGQFEVGRRGVRDCGHGGLPGSVGASVR
jgi:hypothetical protein